MNEQIETILEKLTPEESQTVLHFAEFLLQKRQVTVDARSARRQVSSWLVREVGNLLMGGEPEYMPGEPPLWRVPVLVTHSRQGCATYVDVDARTGNLLINQNSPQKVLADVKAFVANSTSN